MMAIKLIGKTAPLPGEIKRMVDDGFQSLELYMREEFLTDRHMKFLSDASRDYGVSFYSVHTPHSKPENFIEILRETQRFALKGKIKVVVVHSSHVDVFSDEVLSNLGDRSFPENGHGHNLPFLEKVFKKGVRITFDMAHFYVASVSSGRDYYDDLETIFKKYGRYIGHLHIADCTERFVGEKFPVGELESYDTGVGDGEIDFFKAMKTVSKYYKGTAVVEVPTERQWKDTQKLKRIISFRPRTAASPRVSRRRRRA